MQRELQKSSILNYISKMQDGETRKYKPESYTLLVELYCEGANIVIDHKRQEIEKVSKEFTKARINYAKALENRRVPNKPATGSKGSVQQGEHR